MTKVGWFVMVTFALVIAAYAMAVLVLPGFGPPFVQQRRVVMPLALYAHLSGSLAALALGSWQFNRNLRNRAIELHRWTGRVYIGAVMVGGVGALALAPYSQEGMVTHLGFGVLAIAWLIATLQAYRRIRVLDIRGHQQWMIRSFALTLAAVMLRIWLPISQVAGLPFAESYQVVSWLCWVPNILIAEWLFVPRATGERPVSGFVAAKSLSSAKQSSLW